MARALRATTIATAGHEPPAALAIVANGPVATEAGLRSVSDKEFSLPLRVYIEDTDAGGIVYYVNYLKFIERARTEFMRSLGLDRAAIFNDELIFVVSGIDARYRRPARLDDELVATAALEAVRGASLALRQRVLRDGEVLFEADVALACVGPGGLAPRRIPKVMLATLRAAQGPRGD
jgi:tol-pal system-associated acyl-CoA thioesterase